MKTFDELMTSDIESKLAAIKGLLSLVDRADVTTADDVIEYINMYKSVLVDQLGRYEDE